jgi:hypothetical protein
MCNVVCPDCKTAYPIYIPEKLHIKDWDTIRDKNIEILSKGFEGFTLVLSGNFKKFNSKSNKKLTDALTAAGFTIEWTERGMCIYARKED